MWHAGAARLVVERADLLEGSSIEPLLLQLVAHVSAYKAPRRRRVGGVYAACGRRVCGVWAVWGLCVDDV